METFLLWKSWHMSKCFTTLNHFRWEVLPTYLKQCYQKNHTNISTKYSSSICTQYLVHICSFCSNIPLLWQKTRKGLLKVSTIILKKFARKEWSSFFNLSIVSTTSGNIWHVELIMKMIVSFFWSSLYFLNNINHIFID